MRKSQAEIRMHIWVDADACPKPVKQILFRAAKRTKHFLTLVSNQYHRFPESEYIESIQVPGGFDVADETIIEKAREHDLVITSDIPLSAKCIEKGAVVLSPRGNLIIQDNLSEILTMRNLKEELRGSGIDTGGPAPMKAKDMEQFANQLDKILLKSLNGL